MTAIAKATEDSAKLTKAEVKALKAHEATIKAELTSYLKVGHALAEINTQRLYRATHRTFLQYVRDRWSFSKSQAYRFIVAAETVADLSPTGDVLPANEAQVRELAKLPKEDRPAAWAEAVRLSNGKKNLLGGTVQWAVRSAIQARCDHKPEYRCNAWRCSECGAELPEPPAEERGSLPGYHPLETLGKLRETVHRMVTTFPEHHQPDAPAVLHDLADEWKATIERKGKADPCCPAGGLHDLRHDDATGWQCAKCGEGADRRTASDIIEAVEKLKTTEAIEPVATEIKATKDETTARKPRAGSFVTLTAEQTGSFYREGDNVKVRKSEDIPQDDPVWCRRTGQPHVWTEEDGERFCADCKQPCDEQPESEIEFRPQPRWSQRAGEITAALNGRNNAANRYAATQLIWKLANLLDELEAERLTVDALRQTPVSALAALEATK